MLREPQSFVYRPRTSGDGDEVGYIPPTCDMHGRPMIPASFGNPNDPRATRKIKAGEEFCTSDEHEAEFMRMHASVRRHWSF
jgi:hypothetical protein